jgi:hypothetical protein
MKGDKIMSRARKLNYKKQKKLFAKTAANEQVRSLNARPRPQRTGFRLS